MNRAMSWALALGAIVMTTASCGVRVSSPPPTTYSVSVDSAEYPPDAYIATVEPVYYEGHAAYWYGSRWYYRDGGGRWNHYDREPPVLYQRRVHAPPARRRYEPPRGRPPEAHPHGRPEPNRQGHPTEKPGKRR